MGAAGEEHGVARIGRAVGKGGSCEVEWGRQRPGGRMPAFPALPFYINTGEKLKWAGEGINLKKLQVPFF